MFKPAPETFNLPLLEEEILRFWKSHHIAEKASTQRIAEPGYKQLYRPLAGNRRPEILQAVEHAFQDLILRYKAMRGYHVSQHIGWQAHDLSVELEAERRLGFTSKDQVEAYGIPQFNVLCQKIAFDYAQDWEQLIERIGSWVDFRGTYNTCTNESIEAVWQLLKSLYKQGQLVLDQRPLPYCPRCGTPLCEHEIVLEHESALTPSAFIRLPLVEDPGTSLLVHTDMPWSLPANVAVAANPELNYTIVERELPEGGVEKLILGEVMVGATFGGETINVFETFKGSRLGGLRYQPLFTYILPEKPVHMVIMDETVSADTGTGLVCVAPPFDALSTAAAQAHNLPMLTTLLADGTFVAEIHPWRGLFFKQANQPIIEELSGRGLIYRVDELIRPLPTCGYCQTPLLNFPTRAWLLHNTPATEKLQEWLHNSRWSTELPGVAGHLDKEDIPHSDSLISHSRYWGTPLPIWECDTCHHRVAVASLAELSHLAERDLSEIDLHRPNVDSLELDCPECNGRLRRVPEVCESRFELAALASQNNTLEIPPYQCQPDQSFLSTLPSNKNDILEILRQYGADAFRWSYYTSWSNDPMQATSAVMPGDNTPPLLRALWEVYTFFVTHANLDGWTPGESDSETTGDLNGWLLSRLHILARDVTTHLEEVDSHGAARLIQAFVIDDLAGWYLTYARRVLNQETFPNEKYAVYIALYITLINLTKLIAPAIPFLAEKLYQDLVRAIDSSAPLSVHLTDWLAFDTQQISGALEEQVNFLRDMVNLGYSARRQGKFRLTQPLADLVYVVNSQPELQFLDKYAWLLKAELNVKRVRAVVGGQNEIAILIDQGTTSQSVSNSSLLPSEWLVLSQGDCLAALATRLSPELIKEGLACEFIARVLELRNKAGLKSTDQVRLSFSATPVLSSAIDAYRQLIVGETQCVELKQFSQVTSQPSSDVIKGLFTIADFDGEKVTFGFERTQD